MISLRRYLEWEPRQRVDAYHRTMELLLEGIRLHAVDQDALELERFRQEIARIEQQLSSRLSPQDLLVLAGKAVKALEEYHRSTSRYIKGRTSQLEEIAAMLSRTLRSIAEGSEDVVSRLGEIEFGLKKASNSEDIAVLKSHLSECLTAVQHASQEERERTSGLITTLEESLRKAYRESAESATRLGGPGEAIADVPAREEGEQAIAEAIANRRHTFVLIVTLPQLATLNARYSFAAGNAVLKAVAEHLREKSPERARIFRWTGASFVVLWDFSGVLEHARRAVAPVTATRLSRTLQFGGRSVMVNIAMATTVIPLYEFRNAEAACKKMDWFVSIKLTGPAAR